MKNRIGYFWRNLRWCSVHLMKSLFQGEPEEPKWSYFRERLITDSKKDNLTIEEMVDLLELAVKRAANRYENRIRNLETEIILSQLRSEEDE